MAKSEKTKTVNQAAPFGFMFFLTYFGTLVYFLDNADGFWEIIFSFLQAAVWPALLIYKIFTILNI